MTYLLDTNILTAIIKNNQKVMDKLEQADKEGREVLFSGISYYEIQRGFLAVGATKKLLDFENFCDEYKIVLLDDIKVFRKAAEIHANLKLIGLPIQEPDIFIAATAIINNFTLVSHDSDFLRVTELKLEDWLS